MIHLVGIAGIFLVFAIVEANRKDDIRLLADLQGIVIFVFIVYCVLRLAGYELAFVAQW